MNEKSDKSFNEQASDFNLSDFIDTEAAAKILSVKRGTLEIWRHQGKGPKFHKFGRSVRYSRDGLKAYSANCCRVSTSDDGQK